MSQTPFETVVREHGGFVLRLCESIVGDEADDAWSETFVAALRAWPDMPDGLAPRPWLAVVARRKCLDLIRARSRRRADLVADVPDLVVDDPPDDEGVWRHVADLPPKQRAVITYRYLGGLSYAQIVEQVGGTEAAARRAASDGLRSLRDKEIR